MKTFNNYDEYIKETLEPLFGEYGQDYDLNAIANAMLDYHEGVYVENTGRNVFKIADRYMHNPEHLEEQLTPEKWMKAVIDLYGLGYLAANTDIDEHKLKLIYNDESDVNSSIISRVIDGLGMDEFYHWYRAGYLFHSTYDHLRNKAASLHEMIPNAVFVAEQEESNTVFDFLKDGTVPES